MTSADTSTTSLQLTQIRTDGGTQPRAQLDQATITDYAADMRGGAQFPPIQVFFDGTDHWLADGFHRVAAARQADRSEIAADVHQGTRRDAVLYSTGVNATHGLRRTNEDKRRAVTVLLKDDEWSQWSDREIARRCKVTHPFVSKVRGELTGNVSSEPESRAYKTRHGTPATMDTRGISEANQARATKPTAHQQKVAERIVETLHRHGPLCWADLRKHAGYDSGYLKRALPFASIYSFEDEEGAEMWWITGEPLPEPDESDQPRTPATDDQPGERPSGAAPTVTDADTIIALGQLILRTLESGPKTWHELRAAVEPAGYFVGNLMTVIQRLIHQRVVIRIPDGQYALNQDRVREIRAEAAQPTSLPVAVNGAGDPNVAFALDLRRELEVATVNVMKAIENFQRIRSLQSLYTLSAEQIEGTQRLLTNLQAKLAGADTHAADLIDKLQSMAETGQPHAAV